LGLFQMFVRLAFNSNEALSSTVFQPKFLYPGAFKMHCIIQFNICKNGARYGVVV